MATEGLLKFKMSIFAATELAINNRCVTGSCATISAEFMLYAKPHPEVYLTCANQLAVHPANCLVVEDSVNGCISGKAAQMKVISVPDIDHKNDERFGIADYKYTNMVEALNGIKQII